MSITRSSAKKLASRGLDTIQNEHRNIEQNEKPSKRKSHANLKNDPPFHDLSAASSSSDSEFNSFIQGTAKKSATTSANSNPAKTKPLSYYERNKRNFLTAIEKQQTDIHVPKKPKYTPTLEKKLSKSQNCSSKNSFSSEKEVIELINLDELKDKVSNYDSDSDLPDLSEIVGKERAESPSYSPLESPTFPTASYCLSPQSQPQLSNPIPLMDDLRLQHEPIHKHTSNRFYIDSDDQYTLSKLQMFMPPGEEKVEIVLGTYSDSYASNCEDLLNDFLNLVKSDDENEINESFCGLEITQPESADEKPQMELDLEDSTVSSTPAGESMRSETEYLDRFGQTIEVVEELINSVEQKIEFQLAAEQELQRERDANQIKAVSNLLSITTDTEIYRENKTTGSLIRIVKITRDENDQCSEVEQNHHQMICSHEPAGTTPVNNDEDDDVELLLFLQKTNIQEISATKHNDTLVDLLSSIEKIKPTANTHQEVNEKQIAEQREQHFDLQNVSHDSSKNALGVVISNKTPDTSDLSMSRCLNLINNSVIEISPPAQVVKSAIPAKVSRSRKLLYANDSLQMHILLEIEKTLVSYFKVSYSSIAECRKHKLIELSFDFCKFLLDSHLKQNPIASHSEQNVDQMENNNRLKWLVMLNFCFIASDLLFNASWRLFFDSVESFKQKFPSVSNYLNEIMFQIERTVFKAFNVDINILNAKSISLTIPKIYNLCAFLNEIAVSDGKYLIIMSKALLYYFLYLKAEIEEETSLKVECFITGSQLDLNKFEDLSKQKPFNCLIVNHNVQLYQYIPNFRAVIVYDKVECLPDKTHGVKEACVKCKVDYIEFDFYTIESKLLVESETLDDQMTNSQLLVSSKIWSTELVEFMENELFLSLITRDYGKIENKLGLNDDTCNSMICDVDILFDELTGLVFFSRDMFYPNGQFSDGWLLDKLGRYKCSLQLLYVVIYEPSGCLSNGRKPDLCDLDQDLRDLKKSVFWSGKSEHSFDFKILILENFDNLKKLVVNILRSSREKRKQLALAYPVLSEITQNDELFLISSGFFNSFSAQYVLQRCTLVQIAELYQNNEFAVRYPVIRPEHVHMYFKMLRMA